MPNHKYRKAFTASTCLVSPLLLFGPLEILIRENNPPLLPLVYSLVALSLLSLCLILLLGWVLADLLPPRISEVATPLMITVGFLCYLQANIMPFPFGPLDGRAIPWSNFKLYMVGESCLWVAGIILGIRFRNHWIKHLPKLAGFFILYQLILLVFFWSLTPASQPGAFRFTDDTKYRFSSTENILIIVLDTFQSAVFEEIVKEDIYYRDIFKNFTYFPDTIGGFCTTKPSVPLILTGQMYDNSIPFQAFVDAALKNGSIPSELLAAGYRVEAFDMPLMTDVPVFSNLEANHSPGLPTLSSILERLCGYFIKCTPSFLKSLFLNYYYEHYFAFDARSDLRFVKEAEKSGNLGTDSPVFKYIHLRGVHPPFVINESMSVARMEQNLVGYKQQAKACLKIMGRFLNTLRRIGAYDNAMIFVIGDHGWSSGYGMANPLFLWKPFKSASALRIHKAPVSFVDIKKTILEALKGNPGAEGFSLLHLDSPGPERQRRFMDYAWEHMYWWSEYMPPMRAYAIAGPALDPCPWEPSFVNYRPGKIEVIRNDAIPSDGVLYFKKNGNYANYVGLGWSHPEKDWVWNDGRWASIYLPVADNQLSVRIVIEAFPFLPSGSRRAQRVKVAANCVPVADLIVDKPGKFEFAVPRSCLAEKRLSLIFEFPDAISPSELRLSEDLRRLGLAFKKIGVRAE